MRLDLAYLSAQRVAASRCGIRLAEASVRGRLPYSARSLVFAARSDRELAEELRFHIEEETEKNLATGLKPREARRQAHIKFGEVERMRERDP